MRPLLAALALASLAVVAPVPHAALAQQADPASVVLLEQDAWVAPGTVSLLRIGVEGPRRELEVRVSLHASLSTRTGFEQTVVGSALGARLGVTRVPLATRDVSADGELVVPLGIGAAVAGPGVVALPVRGTGVYPLAVELARPGEDPLAGFVTWLVVVAGEPVAEPLGLAWIWSLGAPPLLDEAGTPTEEVLGEFAPGGSLDAVAGLLERAEGVPLTLSTSPQTVAAWRAASEDVDLRPGFTAVRRAAQRADVQVLAAPFVPIDQPALARAGLADLVSQQLLDGVDTLGAALGVRIDNRTVLADPLDDPALVRLRTLFVDRVVVPDDALVAVVQRLTPARPFTLAAGGAGLRAIGASEELRALLEERFSPDPEPRALRAQRFLAALSLIALEEPALPRGVVVAEPMPWAIDPVLVDTVVEGLRDHPLVRAETLDAQFARVPDDTVDGSDEPLVRTLEPIEVDPLAFSADDYADVGARLTSFASVMGGDDSLVARGREALRVAPSSLLDDQQARAELDGVRRGITEVLGAIGTTGKSVTLTARRAEIPLSFRNDAGKPVTVRLRFESTKLLFPAGSEQVVELAEGNTTMQVPVEARASGAFTMTVTITSRDGYLRVGDPARIRVQSTVFSGMGAFLTGGAALFLVLWWALHLWRRRRARAALGDGAR